MTKSKIGKLAVLGLAAGLTLLSATGFAAGARRASGADSAEADALAASLERVDSIVVFSRGPHSWQAIDDDTVIIWATAFDPYLVELAFRSPDLRFAHVIGVTQMGSRVYAKFDAVKVGGFRYPIDSIYKMTREEARGLARGA
jgi:IS4 transposase